MVFVITVDQRSSRRRGDLVEALLADLAGGARAGGEDAADGLLLPFERTAGDEAQGVLAAPAAVCDLVLELVRRGAWHIGLGVGPVDEPLPDSTRKGRGEAFVRAREAVTRAKTAPHRVGVVGAADYRARHVEAALWMLGAILERRTARGWEVADMLAQGRSRGEIAEALGISASAVTQRAQAAGVAEERRGRELLTALLAEADR